MTTTRDELRKLAEAATPGPWVVTRCEPCARHGREDIQIWDEQGNLLIAQWMDEVDPDAGDDAEFIAAARTAFPALLDQLDQAEARIRDLAQEVRDERGAALDQIEQVKIRDVRIKAVQDVLDVAASRVAHDTRYAVTSNRLDVIVNGAAIRRALDGDHFSDGASM